MTSLKSISRMNYSNNISTNILRDEKKEIDYVVTPNSKEIFDRLFINNYGSNRSFNLIGNYGTGKSTFLWAIEKNLNNEKIFFNTIDYSNKSIKGYDFIKLLGDKKSLSSVFKEKLKLEAEADSSKIIDALSSLRKKSSKKKKGLILLMDEFGKFLEFAAKEQSTDEIYLLQLISEWANDDSHETFFITTLHQNFSSYGRALNAQDRLEWEKVKGRFHDLTFNEPVEQLIYFASKKLNEFEIPLNLKDNFEELVQLIQNSKLVSQNNSLNQDLSQSLFPLDWLSTHILVNALQRYGQNERSLFSFLSDSSKYSISNDPVNFYNVSDVFDYLVYTLPTEINGPDNPHKAQWLTTFRVLERAELIFEEDYEIVTEVIKTISLVNIFSKLGGLFNQEFLNNYFRLSRGFEINDIIDRLISSGLVRFYKHSNKLNFFEGTDIDLEQELIDVSKEINTKINLSNEIIKLVDLPVLLAKRISFEKGTKRFFEYRIFDNFNNLPQVTGVIDGYINLIFEELEQKEIKECSIQYPEHIFVLFKDSKIIKETLFTILKFDKLIEKHQLDKNALKLLGEERAFYLNKLNEIVLKELFTSDQNLWFNAGKKTSVNSRTDLFKLLSNICEKSYEDTPTFNNELINRHALSTPINTARKYLYRAILKKEHEEDLGFDEVKFPPEKAIYISLLKETGIHQSQKSGFFKLAEPPKGTTLFKLWSESNDFLNSARNSKKSLADLYKQLSLKPFKLKKGFIEFWIPIFLIAQKEEYALFHRNGGYIPYLKEDILDLIHKKPEDYLIKTYNVSESNNELLNGYKKLFGKDKDQGTQTTILSIFVEFLKLRSSLKNYTLETLNLSKESSIKLRAMILESKDPEETLLTKIPKAFNFDFNTIKNNSESIAEFTDQIAESIEDLKGAYPRLLNRIETTITEAFDCQSNIFSEYKKEIIKKLETIEHNLLSQKQNIFYKRLVSPLDIRDSWIKSVADNAMGKSIENMLDDEEAKLIKNIKDFATGLLKSIDISRYNKKYPDNPYYSIRFFNVDGSSTDATARIETKKNTQVQKAEKAISRGLKDLDNKTRKNILIELLSNEMKNNKS